MIKLFVTDMDHTLLDNDSLLPNDFNFTLKSISEHNASFALASGRTLFSIKNKVNGHLDYPFAFISDNGAIVEISGKIIYESVFTKSEVRTVIDVLRNCSHTTICASTKDTAYVELYNDEHGEFLHEYYPNYEIVDDILSIDDKIVKLTTLNTVDSFKMYEDHIDHQLNSSFNAVRAGKVWIDIMHKGVSKGSGLELLLNELGIEHDEVAAFGDFHNDIPMLELAKYSYAVENAHDDVKKIASKTIGNNFENAVTKQILNLLDIKK